MKKNITLIIILLSCTYFISQFYRASLGVVAIDISSDLNLNSEQLGRLGGVFFLAFALTQIPLGIALDKYNPIKIIIFMLLIIFIGSLIFSFGNNLNFLILARALQGIGCGVCLMGPLVVLTRILKAREFAFYSGIVMGMGGLGALFATEPFYNFTNLIGWKNAFFYSSFLILLLIILLFFFFPKEDKLKNTLVVESNLQAFKEILKNKNFLLMLPMSMFGYASFAFILTLWGGKYLLLVHDISNKYVSIILMCMALFWAIGSIVFGAVEKKINRKKVILITSAVIMILLLSLLCLNIFNSIFLFIILFSLLGFFGAFTLILISHYRVIFSEKIIGKVLTTANLFNFFGVFLVQWVTGIIIMNLNEKYNFSISLSYSIAFMVVILFLIFAIILYLKTDEV